MPLAALGLAAGAVGTGLSIAGNAQSQSAMNKVRADAAAKQAAIQQQANNITSASIAASGPQSAATDTAAGTANREAVYNQLKDATAPIAQANPTGGAGSARSAAAGNVWGNLVANNTAKAGSYQDWETNQNIKNVNAAQKLGILSNFSQGDASILPVEMQVASQAGDKLSGWGSIVSGLGSALGNYGTAQGIMNKMTLPAQSAGAYSEFMNGDSSNTQPPSVWADWKG